MVKYINESKKRVTEAADQIDMDIKINPNMENLPEDILDEMYEYESLQYYPKYDDTPMPWDADMWIEDGKMIFSGGLGPGSAGGGKCVCEVPLKNADQFYTIHVRTKSAKVIDALYKAGWLQ